MIREPASGRHSGHGLLGGCRVLIVEDEYFQAREIALALGHAGAEVAGPLARVEEVSELADFGPIDAAMLDINLGRGASFEIARSMRARCVPFLFLTGYDASVIPGDLSDTVRLEKPVDHAVLIERLAGIVTAEI